MGMSPNFDIDLAHGEAAEGLLEALLKDRGKRVEVKRDRQAHRTGNVAVEYRCRGRASGIETTEAEWWAWVLDDADGRPVRVVMITTEHLKLLVEGCRKLVGREVRGGDDNESEMVLVPIRSFLPYARNWV